MTIALLALLAAASISNTNEPPQDPPPTVKEVLVVTPSGTERELQNEPGSVAIVSREDLENDPSLVLDELLVSVPGFSLFRRQSSIAAHPTTQGVSLRGTGASGAGRALVMRDGIPLNDPFGGWVLWGQAPRQGIDHIEVLRGGGADLYGSSALGGVVQIFTRSADANAISLDASGGDLETVSGSLLGTISRDPFSATLTLDDLSTDGWFIRPDRDLGSVDHRTRSEHGLADLDLRLRLPESSAFLTLTSYSESRNNGTRLQINDDELNRVAGGFDWLIGDMSVNARAWITDQKMHSTFSAVADDRESERLVLDQRVPSAARGFTLRTTRSNRDEDLILGGVELRQVDATSRETVMIPGNTIERRAGGTQDFGAVWAEYLLRPQGPIQITAGVRFDQWTNRSIDPAESHRTDSEVSPRVSVLYRVSGMLALTGSAYRGFRAPTLNELYRGFRVGDVVTDPSSDLKAETMTGFDAGLNAAIPGSSLSATLRVFRMTIDDPVANVTVENDGKTIRRRRMNLGQSRSSGIESDIRWRITPELRVQGGWLRTESVVTAFSADPAIEGNRIPQVPRNQGSLELLWTGARTTAAIGGRYSGSQYEDDENRYLLPSFTSLDLRVSRAFSEQLDLFLACQNLFGERWIAGRTPAETLGPPRLLRAGFRWRSN